MDYRFKSYLLDGVLMALRWVVLTVCIALGAFVGLVGAAVWLASL